MREGKANEFSGARELQLLDDKIRMAGEGRTTVASYDHIERIASDSSRMYVYIGTISAYIIPMSAFADSIAKQSFLDIIREKCGMSE